MGLLQHTKEALTRPALHTPKASLYRTGAVMHRIARSACTSENSQNVYFTWISYLLYISGGKSWELSFSSAVYEQDSTGITFPLSDMKF